MTDEAREAENSYASHVARKRLNEAKVKLLAKKFKQLIPSGFAIDIPNEIVDSLSDNEVSEFFQHLKNLGLSQEPNGKWCKAPYAG